jgi:glutamine synthetase
MKMTAKEVMELIQQKDVKYVDFRFMDLPGIWQHITTPVKIFDEDIFKDGKGFDGSSIRGFKAIDESDMLLIPDPTTAFIDPFFEVATLVLICNVIDPVTRQTFSRDARYVAQKAEQYLKSTGLGDISYWGPEAEFFIFNDMKFDQTMNSGYYSIDSTEGLWNTGRDEGPNLAYKIRNKEGYFPTPPMDSQQDIRSEMTSVMQEIGIPIETHHHEVATAGQAEIDMIFDSLVVMADKLTKYKYVVKNVARRHNMVATFMPKPLFGDNGSGMHVHQSIWKGSTNTFFDEKGYAGLSQNALYYIGGLIKHAPALCAIICPTVNSYKRLTPGFEAPVNLVYSQRNRSAACRIPLYSKSPKSKRVEFRPPDPSCNPYLAFSAMLMAGLDGIQNKTDPGKPMDVNLYDLESRELKKVKNVPSSLDEALDHLEKDHEFLLKGGVFTEDLVEEWISYKRSKEVDAIRLRPHPYEFVLYHDI